MTPLDCIGAGVSVVIVLFLLRLLAYFHGSMIAWRKAAEDWQRISNTNAEAARLSHQACEYWKNAYWDKVLEHWQGERPL